MDLMQTTRQAVGALLVAFLLSSCATTAGISRFESLASTGVQYSEALGGLLTTTGRAAIDASSIELILNREALVENPPTDLDLGTVIDMDQVDDALRDYLGELALLRKHVRLLGSYFRALSALAASDRPEAFKTEVERNALALNELTVKLKERPFFKNSEAAGRLAGSVGELIVRGVQLRLLKEELEARKKPITEILLLHEELMGLLRAELENKEALGADLYYERNVREPFLQIRKWSEKEEKEWMAKRQELIAPTWAVAELDSAVSAARGLRLAWRKLLQDDLTIRDIDAVLSDINSIVGIIEATEQLQEAPSL